MKILKNIGFITFLLGILLFTLTIFLGSYKITEQNVYKLFDTNLDQIDAGDTIAQTFLDATAQYETDNSINYSNLLTFNAALPHIIALHNEKIRADLTPMEGIGEKDKELLFSRVNVNGKIEYSEEVIRHVFTDNPLKIDLLVNNTSWMYSENREYSNFTEFEQLFTDKVTALNKQVGSKYQLQKDPQNLMNYAKAFLSSGIKSNTWLWFFLTFGLAIIGGIVYNFAMFKLLGPPGIKNNGVYHDSLSSRGWVGWLVMFYLVAFYVILYFYPNYLVNTILLVDPISKFLSGNAASHWFLYGFLYCVAMTVMAIRMWIKYRHNKYQVIRTAVVLFFQLAFAFLIPELLIRLNMPYYDFKNAWPLNYGFLFEGNINNLIASGNVGIFMLVWGIVLSAIIVPVLVYFFGKRWYCSWVCGCGGLAETLGDPYRQLSNKKMWAWKLERWLIHGVLVFAVVMTAITLYTFFTGAQSVIGIQTYSIQKTYGFLIGSIFSGVIGTGFYPIFGNRTWCRFGCPLAAYLGLVQRFKSRFRITTNGGQCISCGNCSTYCEQGIDVRAYAQKGQNIVRSSCVGCGVCSAVCPRGVLKLENGPEKGRFGNEGPIVLGNNGFELKN